ncbi:MAG TPA: hypothetical protein VHC97_08230 [Thermoanaerobaculia bacterium]|jgi:hypothetical protein|nr:hypothetical protein [Thermoanaerobaculia bacterium]
MAKSKQPAREVSDSPAADPLETWTSRLRRKPVVALLILLSTITGGLAGFTSALDSIGDVWDKLQKRFGSGGGERLPRILSQSEPDCVRSDLTCQVDLWLENPHDKPLYVTALSLRVLDVENEPTLGKIEPSATYSVDLTGLNKAGMTRTVPLRQEIEAGKSDRFVLSLGARDLGDRFRRWHLEAKLETSGGVLPIQPLEIKLPWDFAYSASPPVALPSSTGTNR